MSNRAALVERRLEELEKKLTFTMQTLAVTRQDQIGTMVSQSFETLFQMAVKREKDTAVVEHASEVAPSDTGSPSARSPQSAPGPDGFPREDRSRTDTPAEPASGDIGRAASTG
jgi:hypothetical protein